MANRLEKVIRAISKFDFEKEQRRILSENTDVLVELQRIQWSEESKSKTGRQLKILSNSRFGFGYTPRTKKLKKKYGIGIGRITNRVTFYGKGDLYKGLFVKVGRDYITWGSTVSYFNSLMERTGNPQGLSKKYRTEFRKNVTEPQLRKRFYDKIRSV